MKAHISARLTSHSFRRGGASFLLSSGIPLSQIKERGGWKSNCVITYVSDPLYVRVKRELEVSRKFF